MPRKTTRGVVIAEKSYGENDKIVTLFSEEGKFNAIARGVKSPRSKLAAGCRLFAWSEFEYFPSKNLATVGEAHLIDPFYNLSGDLTSISHASYLSDLVNQFYVEFQPDKVILKHLVYCLFYINKDLEKVYLITLAFQIKLLTALGLIPDIKGILKLDQDLPVYFSPDQAVFSNKKSDDKLTYRLSPQEVKILIDLYRLPIKEINQLNLKVISQEDLKRLIEILNTYIQYQLRKELKSYKILKELN